MAKIKGEKPTMVIVDEMTDEGTVQKALEGFVSSVPATPGDGTFATSIAASFNEDEPSSAVLDSRESATPRVDSKTDGDASSTPEEPKPFARTVVYTTKEAWRQQIRTGDDVVFRANKVFARGTVVSTGRAVIGVQEEGRSPREVHVDDVMSIQR
jgi:hypothetical protein